MVQPERGAAGAAFCLRTSNWSMARLSLATIEVMALTLAAPAEHELVVKKSRFLGRVEPCADRAAALARVRNCANSTRAPSMCAGPCWPAAIPPPTTTANPAAPLAAPCSTCCATKASTACWPPPCATGAAPNWRRRPGARLHRLHRPGPAHGREGRARGDGGAGLRVAL